MTSGAWLVQHLLPKDAISKLMYRVARSERAWLSRPLIRWFARTYRVDLTEAEQVELEHYLTFNAFFPRALRWGTRPTEGDPATVIAPADGTLTEFGALEAGTLLQAKGRSYSIEEL